MQKDGGCVFEHEVKVSGGFSGRAEVLSLADLMFILVSHSLVCITIQNPKASRSLFHKPQALRSHQFIHKI